LKGHNFSRAPKADRGNAPALQPAPQGRKGARNVKGHGFSRAMKITEKSGFSPRGTFLEG
jgi:hypothetical protein